MADITSAKSKLNTDEVAQDKPVTEALYSKIGANINALIDDSATALSTNNTQTNRINSLVTQNNAINTVLQLVTTRTFALTSTNPSPVPWTVAVWKDDESAQTFFMASWVSPGTAGTAFGQSTGVQALSVDRNSWDVVTWHFWRSTPWPTTTQIRFQFYKHHTVSNVTAI